MKKEISIVVICGIEIVKSLLLTIILFEGLSSILFVIGSYVNNPLIALPMFTVGFIINPMIVLIIFITVFITTLTVLSYYEIKYVLKNSKDRYLENNVFFISVVICILLLYVLGGWLAVNPLYINQIPNAPESTAMLIGFFIFYGITTVISALFVIIFAGIANIVVKKRQIY